MTTEQLDKLKELKDIKVIFDAKKVETIARICHAANRSYCQELGDMSQPIWECSAGWQRQSAIAGVTAVINNPEITPEQTHEAWVEHKIKDGWKCGPKKDERKKEHPCIVSYDQLPDSQKQKDRIFAAIVKSFL